ncbi:hypothetical protein U2A404210063 [Corynebacterium striatum]|nr:hypothetical protein U2A404210063 [Corynebacterium striatum]
MFESYNNVRQARAPVSRVNFLPVDNSAFAQLGGFGAFEAVCRLAPQRLASCLRMGCFSCRGLVLL